MQSAKHYRGSALQGTLRRAFHPNTPEPERAVAIAKIAELDPQLRFIETLDPNYSRLPEWHPTAVWRARLAAKDQIIAARDDTIRQLRRGQSARLADENKSLRSRLKEKDSRVANLTRELQRAKALLRASGIGEPVVAATKPTIAQPNGAAGEQKPRRAKNQVKRENDGRLNPQTAWNEEEHQFLIDTIRANPRITDVRLAEACTAKFQPATGRTVGANTIKGIIGRLRDQGRLPPAPRKRFWDGSFPY